MTKALIILFIGLFMCSFFVGYLLKEENWEMTQDVRQLEQLVKAQTTEIKKLKQSQEKLENLFKSILSWIRAGDYRIKRIKQGLY